MNGVKTRVEKLCQAFENGKELVELSQASPHDISNVLKLYLRQVSPMGLEQSRCWVRPVLCLAEVWPVRVGRDQCLAEAELMLGAWPGQRLV